MTSNIAVIDYGMGNLHSVKKALNYLNVDPIITSTKIDIDSADKIILVGVGHFKKALENVSPALEVKSKRIGGATYQVPVEVSRNRKMALAMRWIIQYSKSRKGHTMADRLAAELIAAANNEGSSVKKKEDTHKMAEANKAFAHFG